MVGGIYSVDVPSSLRVENRLPLWKPQIAHSTFESPPTPPFLILWVLCLREFHNKPALLLRSELVNNLGFWLRKYLNRIIKIPPPNDISLRSSTKYKKTLTSPTLRNRIIEGEFSQNEDQANLTKLKLPFSTSPHLSLSDLASLAYCPHTYFTLVDSFLTGQCQTQIYTLNLKEKTQSKQFLQYSWLISWK